MNNSTMHTATRRISRKAKGGRSLKGAGRLVGLLPFACPFKSSDQKAWLLLGYLLMTFVGDVVIKVTFKVSFLHLYVLGLLEAWPDEIVLMKTGKCGC